MKKPRAPRAEGAPKNTRATGRNRPSEPPLGASFPEVSWPERERHAIEDEGCGRPIEPPQGAPAEGGESTALDGPEPDDDLPFGPVYELEDEGMPDPSIEPREPPPLASQPQSAAREPSSVRILSTAEIFAPQQATNWLVQGLQLAPGRPSLLYGPAGAGKTLIAQSLALFVAAGLPIWERFPTRAGRVLHIDYDQGEHATRRRYQRLAAGHGIELSALGDRLSFMPFPPVYLNSGDKAEAFLLRHCDGVALCVIDALRGAIPHADENDSRIGAYLTVCARVSEKTGTVFVVLHHQGKPKEGATDSHIGPRGSSALLAASGAALLATGSKDTPKRVRFVRDSESFEGGSSADFALRFVDLPAIGDLAPLRVVYDGAAPAEAPADKRNELEGKIVSHVRAHPGCGVTAVREAVKANAALVSQAIGSLTERGILRREEGAHGGVRLFVVESMHAEGEEGPDP